MQINDLLVLAQAAWQTTQAMHRSQAVIFVIVNLSMFIQSACYLLEQNSKTITCIYYRLEAIQNIGGLYLYMSK